MEGDERKHWMKTEGRQDGSKRYGIGEKEYKNKVVVG
jgi:hypothetical protein